MSSLISLVICVSVLVLSLFHHTTSLVPSRDSHVKSDQNNKVRNPDRQLQSVLGLGADWMTMRYRPHSFNQSISTKPGRVFLMNQNYLSNVLGIPVTSYVDLTPEVLDDFVVVTAADLAYGYVVLDAISTFQRFMPGRKIIFYDLGIYDDGIIYKIKRLCDVEYRKFNFSLYPGHVRDLDFYAWKPLLIHEVLREYSGVLWLDSSIRMTSSIPQSVLQEAVRTGGILTFSTAGHSNFAVTDPAMLRYLPSSRQNDGLIQTDQREANSVLVYKTKDVYESVIRWWVLCALEQKCISSSFPRGCDVQARNVFAGCHRFDQSALNILLINRYNFNDTFYLARSATILQVRRYESGRGVFRVKRSGEGTPRGGNLGVQISGDCSAGYDVMKADKKTWIPVKDR